MSNDAVVFVVDPDAASRQVVAAAVHSRGVRAEGFASAAAFLQAGGDPSGCVVAATPLAGTSVGQLRHDLDQRDRVLPIIALLRGPDTATTVAAMRAGVVTVLDMPVDEDRLWEAIASALTIDGERRAQRDQQRRLRQRFAALTDKERDVLEMIVAGKPNKAMANSLGASLRTIENRRREVFSKLGVRSVAELVALALKAEQESVV